MHLLVRFKNSTYIGERSRAPVLVKLSLLTLLSIPTFLSDYMYIPLLTTPPPSLLSINHYTPNSLHTFADYPTNLPN